MSHAAFSLKVFAGYLLILGVLLVFAPNLLLTTFGFPLPPRSGFASSGLWS